MTKELIAEGYVRELCSKIQNLRKEKGFEVVDHIIIEIDAEKELNEMFIPLEKMIKESTLADSVSFNNIDNADKLVINDKELNIKISRVKECK